MKILVPLLVVAAGVFCVMRRADVRLVLASCGAILFAWAGNPLGFFVKLGEEMTNLRTVVPICSAMGFAFVLNLTGCDKHLVHLLVRPLRRVRFLLIPGGVAAGFFVNTAIVSQAGTAAVVGPVLLPLLRAAGFSPVTGGSLLLLGASVGGELFNPSAVENVTLAKLTGLLPAVIVRRTLPFNLTASIVALLVFWWLTTRRGRELDDTETAIAEEGVFRVSPLRALVPLVPLLLLFLVPPFVRLPKELASPIDIAAAMVIGVVVATLVTPHVLNRVSTAFFEGAGYAYTHVISLIISAMLFTEGIKATGLIERLAGGVADYPVVLVLVSVLVPWGLGVVCGSGIAPAVATMGAMVPLAVQIGSDPARLGALCSVAGQLGRTMSPVAAVAVMCATLSQTTPLELVRRVAPALMAGGLVMLAAALLKIL